LEGKIIESILLGLIQGMTEFLPISSSAHLKFFEWLFNWTEITPDFADLLNLGTLLALCIYFFKDGLELVKCGFSKFVITILKNKKLKINEEQDKNGKLFWYIVAATIPTAILYLALHKISEKIIGDNESIEIILIAVSSIVMGILLFLVDRICSVKKSFDNLSFKDTVLIGVSQAIAAVFPGVSRSGITITTSRTLKYDRASGAKVSFFLSIPLIAGGLLVKMISFDFSYWLPFLLGNIVSFVAGFLVIKVFMSYLRKGKYSVFAIYRVCFGLLLIILLLIRGWGDIRCNLLMEKWFLLNWKKNTKRE